MLSYMTATDDRLTNLADGIAINQHNLVALALHVDSALTNMAVVWSRISHLMTQVVQISADIQGRAEELLVSVHDLVMGILSPSLLPPDILAEALRNIVIALVKTHPQFLLSQIDHMTYYVTGQFAIAGDDEAIYILMRFPLST